MEKLRTLADGKTTITLFTYLNHATLDVIANVINLVFVKLHVLLYSVSSILKGGFWAEREFTERQKQQAEHVHYTVAGGR